MGKMRAGVPGAGSSLVPRDVLGRMEGIHAVLEHVCREVMHEGFCLDMKVAHHKVRLPLAQQLDEVGVDVGTHEG